MKYRILARQVVPGLCRTLAAALCMAAPLTQGSTVIEFTYPLTADYAPWTENVDVAQYNPADYDNKQLIGMEWEIQGEVTGTMGAENLDALAPSDVTLELAHLLEVYDAGDTPITSVAPSVTETVRLDYADGSTDYLGPSGETIAVAATAVAAVTTEERADLVTYVGAGTVPLRVELTEETWDVSAVGGKSTDAFRDVEGGGYLVIRYIIPEPSTVLLLGALSVWGMTRRRLTSRQS